MNFLTVPDVRIKILNIDEKKRQFQTCGFVFVGELSPEESPADLRMDETILRFKHPVI
jgi:hypothetical protein